MLHVITSQRYVTVYLCISHNFVACVLQLSRPVVFTAVGLFVEWSPRSLALNAGQEASNDNEFHSMIFNSTLSEALKFPGHQQHMPYCVPRDAA